MVISQNVGDDLEVLKGLQQAKTKKYELGDVVFFVDVYITTGCLCMFVYIWMTSTSCGS